MTLTNFQSLFLSTYYPSVGRLNRGKMRIVDLRNKTLKQEAVVYCFVDLVLVVIATSSQIHGYMVHDVEVVLKGNQCVSTSDRPNS